MICLILSVEKRGGYNGERLKVSGLFFELMVLECMNIETVS